MIAHATAQRASGRAGRRSITVLDECWFLLDSPVLAPEVVQLFRTARKRNASVWGISQTAEDFVGTESSPRVHGAGIVKNSTTKTVGQQPGDVSALREHLHLNETALNQIKHFSAPVKGKPLTLSFRQSPPRSSARSWSYLISFETRFSVMHSRLEFPSMTRRKSSRKSSCPSSDISNVRSCLYG